jgi:hypothetical protein
MCGLLVGGEVGGLLGGGDEVAGRRGRLPLRHLGGDRGALRDHAARRWLPGAERVECGPFITWAEVLQAVERGCRDGHRVDAIAGDIAALDAPSPSSVPDRFLGASFRRTDASTSPIAAAIASSRSLVACW